MVLYLVHLRVDRCYRPLLCGPMREGKEREREEERERERGRKREIVGVKLEWKI